MIYGKKNPKCDSVLMKSENYITDCVVLMVLQKMGNSQVLPVIRDFKLFLVYPHIYVTLQLQILRQFIFLLVASYYICVGT